MNKTNSRAYSLLELLLTLFIIGILAGFALPSYETSLLKSRRVDAKSSLYDLSSRLKECYLTSYDYRLCVAKLNLPAKSQQGFYLLSSLQIQKDHFRIRATALKPQDRDFDCTSFTLSSNQLEQAGGKSAVKDCW